MGKSRLIAEAAELEINSRVELTRLATERDSEHARGTAPASQTS